MQSSYEIFDSAIKQALKKFYNDPRYEDLYQECYMKILEVLSTSTYDPVYNLYGYAYKIARNAISSYLYHNEKLTTLVDDDLPQVWDKPSDANPESDLFIKDTAIEILNRYKNLLPANFTYQDVINLLGYEDSTDLILVVVKGDYAWSLSQRGGKKE